MYYHENWMPIKRGPYTLWPLYKNTEVIQEVVTICPMLKCVTTHQCMQGMSSVVYIIRKDILNVLGQMTRVSHQIESDWLDHIH